MKRQRISASVARRIMSNMVGVLLACLVSLVGGGVALADTMPALFQSFAGNMNFVGTAQTLRTQADGANACTVTTASTSAPLTGIPSGAVIQAAYLYWAGSSTNLTTAPDYTVTFNSNTVSADSNRRYTATYNNGGTNLYYFSGVADVTSIVSVTPNTTYNFSGLTVNAGSPHCDSSGVVAGWALAVIYSHPSEDFRVINVFEGFKAFRGSSVTLHPDNFKVPVSPINGKHAYITWEGDVGNSEALNGFSEGVTFNGSKLSDTNNPATNQFNSISTIKSSNLTTYGVDFDDFDISSRLTAGETSAVSIYSSGADLVLLSSEIISVTNTSVSDLAISMNRNTSLSPGQQASYSLTVSNNGPNTEPGPITVKDTLPAGLSYASSSGTGWSCSASGQLITCIYTGTLANGASAPALTLNVNVASSASGVKDNTATVTGTAFDNVVSNDSATDSFTMTADLAIAISRNGSLTPGTSTTTYTVYVTNNGPSGDPGPVVVTTTLPAGLTYAGVTGTGWTCTANGQVGTCTLSGVLASGASAPPLVVTVTVANGTAGTITNTASVRGGGTDPISANNTATDVFSVGAYAYYKMDESTWTAATGQVLDSSGNTGRNADPSSGSTTVAAPAATGTPNKPNTCRGGSFPADANAAVYAVKTPIDINSLGNAGTISFWYKGNLAWDPSGNNNTDDRTLLDATGNANGEFWLVLKKEGALRFRFDNASSNAQSLDGTARSFGANTWHHIAITWDFGTARRMSIFIDGSQDATQSSNAITSTSAYGTLYIGDSKGITSDDNRGNSANGVIDEVRIYSAAMTASQIAADMNTANPCITVNHYELSVPSASINCMPTTVTVTACANSSSPCTNKSTDLAGDTAVLTTSAGTFGAGASTAVTFNALGTATAILNNPAALDNSAVTVTLGGEETLASNPRQCCTNGTSCNIANSCSTTFNKAGFIFSPSANAGVATIPVQVAGTSSATYYLRSVKSNTTTKACEAGVTGTIPIDFAYQCNDPTTCAAGQLLKINGTAASPNNNSGVTAYSPINLVFDANGNAPLTFVYDDVGRVTLWAKTTVNGAILSGSTNAFVVKPATFVLNNIQSSVAPVVSNPAAADATGNKFVKAGEAFSVTVTALTSGGLTTPNYGKESTPEGVKLTSSLAPGLGLLVNPSLVGSFGGFNNGVATGSGFSWSEVGIIRLTPSVGDGDYLGAGNVTGTTSGNVGRFYPDHFGLTGGGIVKHVVTRSDLPRTSGSISAGSTSLTVAGSNGISVGDALVVLGAGPGGLPLQAVVTSVSGTSVGIGTAAATSVSSAKVFNSTTQDAFTYMGEPMLVLAQVTAYNANEDPTQNYAGNFAKLSASGVGSGSAWFSTGCTGASQCFGLGAINSSSPLTSRLQYATGITAVNAWNAGVGDFAVPIVLNRPVTATADSSWGPFNNLRIGGIPRDSDGVTLPSNGSSDSDHRVDLSADGDATNERRFLFETSGRLGRLWLSSAHGSELLPLPIAATAQYWNGTAYIKNTLDNMTSLVPGDVIFSNPRKNLASGETSVAATPTSIMFMNGASKFTLVKPNGGDSKYDGSLDMTITRFSSYLPGNTARATFGVYKGSENFIYLRENY